MPTLSPMQRSAFTLIELLIVIAIVAILAIVVVLTLNPAQLLMKSRDADRLSDMASLNTALGIFAADQSNGSLGSANTTYVSIPDPAATSTAGDQCQGLSLPALPASDTYFCAASSTFRKINGTGWIPVNFQSISFRSPLGSLPIDPINQASSNLFYTYTTNGSQWEVTAIPESQKYKSQYGASPVVPDYPDVMAQGTNLSLSDLWNPSGLVGYWPFDEGGGTTAYDSSGYGNNGTWSGNTPYYAGGKVGPYAGNFDGSTDYVAVSPSPSLQSTVGTWSAWINTSYSGINTALLAQADNNSDNGVSLFFSSGHIGVWVLNNVGTYVVSMNGGSGLNNGGWHDILLTFNGAAAAYLYVDGIQVASSVPSGSWNFNNQSFRIGKTGDTSFGYFPGLIDDVRIYSRALSPAEIEALYSAEE